MDIFQLLASTKESQTFSQNRVYVLASANYAPLFTARFLNFVRAHNEVHTLHLDEHDTGSVAAQLATSFLGQTIVYWFGNISALDAKKKKWAHTFLASYEGPHQIIAVVDEPLKKIGHGIQITLPDVIEPKDYSRLAEAFGCNKELRCPAERPLLDTACLMLSYQQLLGSKPVPQFTEFWLPRMVATEQSLFALAQPFFAKQPKQFFQKWTAIAHEYAEPFWVSFWADQVWRAYWFVFYAEQGNHAEAKKVGTRLPFSFLQRDWQQHSLAELQAAHEALYTIDFQVKHGAGAVSFDLFFARYFQQQSN
jgi:hypothetical protein